MTQLFKDMAETMAIKIRVANISVGQYENKRNCPHLSELVGMEMALRTLGIEFDFTFDLEAEKITAVTVMGQTVII